jgi:inosine/xanthosine triphosphatase
MSVFTIAVGSTNPVKVAAIEQASAKLGTLLGQTVRIVGVSVPSGVSEQPRTDNETKLGAMNRAKAALAAANADLGIGLEGGVQEIGTELYNSVWIAVTDTQDLSATANGERFPLPEEIATGIRAGEEMGPLMDRLTNTDKIKHKQGMIGVVTNNYFTRRDAYASLAQLAIGLWYGEKKKTVVAPKYCKEEETLP